MSDTDRAALSAAIVAFVTLPLLLGFVVPVAVGAADPWGRGRLLAGLVVVGIGTAVLLATVVAFFSVGGGTLAPWNPPRTLVTSGLFAWCRNPMYVGVIVAVVGWGATFRSPLVLLVAAVLSAGFHLRVTRHEEPWAEQRFGAEWAGYAEQVPRWLPRPPRR